MKKRAFTLTELLVVVVIIGVMSAVVLPKFTKVVESRKTTEAEEMMAAVRNEQEARCSISKTYQTNLSKLASYKAGKNFTYSNSGGVGMTASAKSGKYTLKMPSYADGRICCDDAYCQNSLNKNYPKCSELTASSTFVTANADCGASWEEPGERETGPDLSGCINEGTQGRSCTNKCNQTGTQVRTCINGSWGDWGACSVTDADCQTECDPDPAIKPTAQTKTCSPCGETVTENVTCNESTWTWETSWPDCKTQDQCETCPSGKVEVDGQCCLPGQVVRKGQCLWDYEPKRFELHTLVVCHPATVSSLFPDADPYAGIQGSHAMSSNPGSCVALGYSYYKGGSLSKVNTQGCSPHYAYVRDGSWWNGGERVTGVEVSASESDQDWCDRVCGSQQTSCTSKGIIDKGNPPAYCGTYRCSNGYHCDNATGGTGIGLECVRR